LPHAIGASFAMKGRPVVLVTGDGGFMHGGLVEFNTAVRCKTDLVVVVCNDSAYGAEYVRLRNKQMDPSLLVFNWPDLAPLAVALGGQGVTVRSYDDLTKIDVAIRERNGPLLIDLKIDPDRMPEY
jgi:thiamine pyrophosphate-dependent acetolactate synthase large subunit-like protein